ncbi:MAG: hypothetical protein WBG01_14535 [Bacteroidota bacterium]
MFTATDIEKLEALFGVRAKAMGSNYRFEIAAGDPVRKLALEIYPDIPIGTKQGTLVSVYTTSAHLQLHFCSGYVVSEMLGEATFVGEHDGKLSGLIVEKEGGCSLFANVDRALVSGDFTKLGPEVMLSGIALSLTDGILEKPAGSTSRGGAKKKARSR